MTKRQLPEDAVLTPAQANPRGVIVGQLNDPDRTDYLYRISLKAVIYDQEGKLLVTDEAGRGWHLPGGGIEHGETIEQGFRRELKEEIGYEGDITYRIVGAEPMWTSDQLKMYQMWIVAVVGIESFDFMDSRSRLIDPNELKESDSFGSQMSFKFHQIAQGL